MYRRRDGRSTTSDPKYCTRSSWIINASVPAVHCPQDRAQIHHQRFARRKQSVSLPTFNNLLSHLTYFMYFFLRLHWGFLWLSPHLPRYQICNLWGGVDFSRMGLKTTSPSLTPGIQPHDRQILPPTHATKAAHSSNLLPNHKCFELTNFVSAFDIPHFPSPSR